MSELHPSARRVQALLRAAGHSGEVVEFAETTRTSAEAAAAIGCDVAQIAKSLIFRARPSDRPVLVIASGRNRVNEKLVVQQLVAKGLGEGLARADADFVRDKTGFAIGGVAPIGHATPPLNLHRPRSPGLSRDLGRRRHAARGLPADARGTGADDRGRGHRRPLKPPGGMVFRGPPFDAGFGALH